MERRELICIGCPMGCPLCVEMEGGRILSVTGNTCSRGSAYAEKEVSNPTRIVTSTVFLEGGSRAVVPVKTREGIPKEKVFEVMKALKEVKVKAPVFVGDVIIHNVADTGVDIVATKTV